jgi:hypothetical protein
MPIIKGKSTYTVLNADLRKSLVARLKSEKNIEGPGSPGSPLIFQIPIELSEKYDLLVVWEEWNDVRSDDRTALILDAFEEEKGNISQALGITYAEALEQELLPYQILPNCFFEDVSPEKIKDALLSEGGISLHNGEVVDLRFPTKIMAETAYRNLQKKLPHGFWSIVWNPSAGSCSSEHKLN